MIRIISIGSVIKACHISSKSVLTIFFDKTGLIFYIFSPKALLTNGLFSYNASCLNILRNYYWDFSFTFEYVTGIKQATTTLCEYGPFFTDNCLIKGK